jgi:hypothetical protein
VELTINACESTQVKVKLSFEGTLHYKISQNMMIMILTVVQRMEIRMLDLLYHSGWTISISIFVHFL